jgi:hypothetical protein
MYRGIYSDNSTQSSKVSLLYRILLCITDVIEIKYFILYKSLLKMNLSYGKEHR